MSAERMQTTPLRNREARPNILLLMTDQQRWDSLGCYGADWVETPALDRLAGEGAVFERCYTNNPICTPARASLMTGKPLPGHGVYGLHDILPADEVLFSRRLQDRGYQTALFGKLHVSGRIYEEIRRHPNDGFDHYEWCIEAPIGMESEFNGYSRWLRQKDAEFHARLKREGRNLHHIPRELHLTHWAAERTIDFIKNRRRDQPFFCKMSVFDPHNPYNQYPIEMKEHVDASRLPRPTPPEPGPRPDAISREAEHSYLGATGELTPAAIMDMRLGYYAAIALIDQEIGRVLHELEAGGLSDNTLVIFCSDHGDMLGDHGLLVKGAYFYDPCVRVPLLMRWPAGNFTGEKRVHGLVQLNDLAATVLAAAGASPNELEAWMPEAYDLAPMVRGRQRDLRQHAVCAYRNSGISDTGRAWDPPIHATMIRNDRYKLSWYHTSGHNGHDSPGQLFDMELDPFEQHNLWLDPQSYEIRRTLTEAMLHWLHRQVLLLGSRGGSALPLPSQQLVNRLYPEVKEDNQ